MHIDRMEWWEVDQFVHQQMVNSPAYAKTHEQWDLVPKFLLRLHTDDGHYGVGETSRGVSQQAVEAAGRGLLGHDPRDLNLRRLPVGTGGAVYRAIETAAFDLVGRIRGMSMSQLLGGACRDHVIGSYWAGLQDPEFSVASAEAARDGGYGTIKIKIMDGMDVIERLRRMHEVAPRLRFIVDAMQRYDDYEQMRSLVRDMAQYNVVCLEDPLPKDRSDWYRALRAETDIPIALHLSTTKAILDALQEDAADIFNCSPGSAVEFVAMADIAGAAGKQCWHGSGVDLGILDLTFIHACAVPEAATVPHDILSTPMHVDDFVVTMPARQGERIAVPTSPGLGGELDMEAVQKFLRSSGEIRFEA